MKKFVKDFGEFKNIFGFEEFNDVQLGCYDHIMSNNTNIVVSAPTSSGKTTLFQLAILKQYKHHKNTQLACLYLAPIKSLCHEKNNSWKKKFHGIFKVFELTSDSLESDSIELNDKNIVVSTPEKIDFLSRTNLEYLKRINLLLIDQIHMLNVEGRGGLLQALISRIMSLNSPRILAVSATIPNIQEVAQWLKVPKNNVCIFGQEYRPVSLNKVVLGFKSGNNPFLFQKTLNYKLLQVIRSYSCGKCSLVFCQTQKGTQGACQQIISDMKQRQFIENDKDLLYLTQQSKSISNSVLQMMVAQGIGFHNAGLNMSDRALLQKLFLEGKIRVLCTTSTLAMGVNLPARLVVIKSTQCYRGSGKGYQQYTQIQLEQMMGRAGRIPFDKQGTVVIMTETKNYNKYLSSNKLETLQSHLYQKLCQHINAQIMMNSITCLQDSIKYFTNTFCYIRMQNSPSSFQFPSSSSSSQQYKLNINKTDSLQQTIHKICQSSLSKLKEYQLINYNHQNQKIIPRNLGINVAKNFIEIQTICVMLRELAEIKSERDFLLLLCRSQEVNKFRNKLDERKILKELNQKIRYNLKNAISTPEKKSFVLLQAYLEGIPIQNWQLRKQAKQILYFMKRLTFCLKSLCYQKKLFWPYYLTSIYQKYFSLKFNPKNQQMLLKQFPQLNEKWKTLSLRGFKKIQHVLENGDMIDCMFKGKGKGKGKGGGDGGGGLRGEKNICQKIKEIKQGVMIHVDYKGFNQMNKILVRVEYTGEFDGEFKSISIIVGEQDNNSLYTVRILNKQTKTTTIALNKKPYYLLCLRQNRIGFDQFYLLTQTGNLMLKNPEDLMITKNQKPLKKQRKSLQNNIRNISLEYKSNKDNNKDNNHNKNNNPNNKNLKNIRKSKSHQLLNYNDHKNTIISKIQTMKSKNKNQLALGKKQSRKKQPSQIFQMEENEYINESTIIKKKNYIPLNQYKCWRPGFPAFQCENQLDNRETIQRKLKIRDDEPSKDKLIQKKVEKKTQIQKKMDPYQYFYNLF